MQDRDSRLIYEAYTQVIVEDDVAPAPAAPGMPIQLGAGGAVETGDNITLKIPMVAGGTPTRDVAFKVDSVRIGDKGYIRLVPQEDLSLPYNFALWASGESGHTINPTDINLPTQLTKDSRIEIRGKWEDTLGQKLEPRQAATTAPAAAEPGAPGAPGAPEEKGQPEEEGPWYDDPTKVSWHSQLNPLSKANLSRGLMSGGGDLGLKGSMGSWGKRISNKAVQRMAPEVEPTGGSIYGADGKPIPAGTKHSTGHQWQKYIQPKEGPSQYGHVSTPPSKMAGTRR